MNHTSGSAMLCVALRIDAVASAACAVALLVGGQLLGFYLGLPSRLLWPVGIGLLSYAAALWLVQARPHANAAAVQAVIAANAVWVVASVLTVIFAWLPLTELGTAFVLFQAALVGLIADLEFIGLRRGTAPVQMPST